MTTLYLKGSCKVILGGGRIKTQDPATYTKNGDMITINGLGDGSNVIMNSGSISLGSVGNVFGCGNVISSGGISISGGIIRIPKRSCEPPTIIYGNKRIRLDKVVETGGEGVESTGELDARCVDEPFTGKLCMVHIKGSGDLRIDDHADDRVTVYVVGSGNVEFGQMTLKHLLVSVPGSGDISGDETTVKQIQVNVAGSGDVSGFHVTESGKVNISGSGDVKLTANDPSKIERSCAGSGKVKIRKQN